MKKTVKSRISIRKDLRDKIHAIAEIGEKYERLQKELNKVLENLPPREIRYAWYLSQEKAAQVAQVALRTWVRWETGESKPDSLMPLVRICQYIVTRNRASA